MKYWWTCVEFQVKNQLNRLHILLENLRTYVYLWFHILERISIPNRIGFKGIPPNAIELQSAFGTSL